MSVDIRIFLQCIVLKRLDAVPYNWDQIQKWWMSDLAIKNLTRNSKLIWDEAASPEWFSHDRCFSLLDITSRRPISSKLCTYRGESRPVHPLHGSMEPSDASLLTTCRSSGPFFHNTCSLPTDRQNGHESRPVRIGRLRYYRTNDVRSWNGECPIWRLKI